MRSAVLSELATITPADSGELAHLLEAVTWVESTAPLFRTAKPATPPKHLVSYFAVIDGDHILLVDHKNAQLWLPAGGHVEVDEHPRETVVRELQEELGIQVAIEDVGPPLMVTCTETVGLTAGHTDVSLWYVVHVDKATPIVFDTSEFNTVRWFKFPDVPLQRSDSHLARFLEKLTAVSFAFV
jgi:8-oxo-dGTP pyrophosphatase MutT (NUDIX family)